MNEVVWPTFTIVTYTFTQVSICPSFEQNWNIANTGTEAWPGSCRVIQAGGHPLGATPTFVPPLPPGHSTTVTMKLVAPTTQGTYRGYFHLVTDRGEQVGGK